MKLKIWFALGIFALVIAFFFRRRLKRFTERSIIYIKMEKTWDPVTDGRITDLHPAMREKVTQFINFLDKKHGIKYRITSTGRSIEEQNELYAQGRTTPGKIVTNAKGGQSYHNYKLAIDGVEIKDGKALWTNPNWDLIGSVGESFGFEWGGRWSKPDRPHHQLTGGFHHTELLAKWNEGDRIEENKFVNIA